MYIHNTFGLHIKKRFYGKCFKKYHIVKESMFCEWKYVEICSCILFYCCEFSLCEQSGQLFEILIVDSFNTFGSNHKRILYITLTTISKGSWIPPNIINNLISELLLIIQNAYLAFLDFRPDFIIYQCHIYDN